jgi:hypothetical protein
MSTATTVEKPKTTAAVKPRLVLTHGEKGGVGKTTVARLVADFLASREAAFRAFDAEGAAGQLLRFHSAQTSAVEVENASGIAPVLDFLMDGNPKRLALVDLGARSGEDLKEWLYKGGALEEAESGSLGITVVYVLGGAVDSVGHLKECFAALGTDVSYIVVKNFGVAAKFDVYDGSNVRQDLLAAGAKEISIPALDGTVYQSVDKASVPFSSFIEGEGTTAGFTERRYCRTWLRECFAALEEVAGLLQ